MADTKITQLATSGALADNDLFAVAENVDTAPVNKSVRLDAFRDYAVTNANVGAALYPLTSEESNAGVTPSDYAYQPGDVRRYGAAGNGSTDDTAAIQAAVDVSAQSKEPARLPAGTYLVTSVITLGTGSSLIGDGEFRSRILCGSATANVLQASSKSLITIEGIEIYFNVTRTAGSAILMTSVSQYLIRDVRILAPWNGITLVTCTGGQIDHVRITTGTGGWNRGLYVQECTSSEFRHIDCVYGDFTPAAYCFEIQSDCDTLQFYYCQGTSGGGSGNCVAWVFRDSSATVPPRWIKLFGCTAEGGNSGDFANTEDGFQVISGTSIEFTNCYAAICDNGLRISGGNGVRWIGGEIFANSKHGAYITGGIGVLISNADIHNNSRETSVTYDGINVGSAVTSFKIVNNDIGTRGNFSTSSAHRYDIAIESAASDRFIVTGNNLFDGDTGPLLDLSTGTQKIIKNNLHNSSNVITFTDADATPDVSVGEYFSCANTGATTITDFDGAYYGKEITVRLDVNTTIQNNSNIATGTGADLTGSADNAYRFANFAGKWVRSF